MRARTLRGDILCALAAFALLSGCPQEPTQLVVHLDADQTSRDGSDQLRVQVFGDDGTVALDKTIKLSVGAEERFPFTVPLAPKGGDASRAWALLAELSSKGTIRSRLRATGGYTEGELRELWLSFDESCWDGLSCGKLESCHEGRCELACVEPGKEGSKQRTPRRCKLTPPDSALKSVKFWGCQLLLAHNLSVEEAVASRYDMLVLEMMRTEPAYASFDSKGMVQKLHATKGKSGNKRLVLAYISIGGAEDWRYYWKSSWIAPTSSKVGDPDFLVVRDPDGAVVAHWDQRWKEIILHGIVQEVLNDGYDGVFLAWVHSYSHPEIHKLAKDQGRNSKTAMVDFIGEIRSFARKQDPGFLVVVENAPELAEGHPSFRTFVDGLAQEHVYFEGTDVNWSDPAGCDIRVSDTGDKHSRKYYNDQLKPWLDAGFPIFNLEYACDKNNVDEAYSLSKQQGYVPYVSRVRLSHLTETPPPGY